MPKLLILQGPPATGKSTFRKELIQSDITNWEYVNLDEIRDFCPTYKEHQILRIQDKQVNLAKEHNKNIIIDNTNLNPNVVQRWINWANSNGYDYEIKQFFDVPLYEAIKRDTNREHSVGRSVIIQAYMKAGIFSDAYCFNRDTIIIDLDGTMCDISHRRHYVITDGQKKDWKSFFSELCNDSVNIAVKLIYDWAIAQHTTVIFLSGRPSEYRKQTEKWLESNNLNGYYALFMRNFNDKRDDTIVKQELYEQYIKPYFNVKFALDDRNRVVDMWRSLGIPCFQVAPGDF